LYFVFKSNVVELRQQIVELRHQIVQLRHFFRFPFNCFFFKTRGFIFVI